VVYILQLPVSFSTTKSIQYTIVCVPIQNCIPLLPARYTISTLRSIWPACQTSAWKCGIEARQDRSLAANAINMSGQPSSGLGLNHNTWLGQFQIQPTSQSAGSWQAPRGHIPLNQLNLPGSKTYLCSKFRLCESVFTICYCIQWCQCKLQKVEIWISLFLINVLAALIIKTTNNTGSTSSWIWISLGMSAETYSVMYNLPQDISPTVTLHNTNTITWAKTPLTSFCHQRSRA
jgi:hypothetical protein